jgi:anaerobic selenocysteine-containing dehydrogenase
MASSYLAYLAQPKWVDLSQYRPLHSPHQMDNNAIMGLQGGYAPYRSVISLCGVCPAGCAVEVHLTGGRIDRIAPLKNHPHGIVCPRGRHAREIVYSPDRLLYPQKRNDAGTLSRINWDEAYDGIVGRIQEIAAQFGPESICVYTGRGNFEYALNEAFGPSGTVESSANTVLFPSRIAQHDRRRFFVLCLLRHAGFPLVVW